MARLQYKVAQHPKTKLWHVIGNCGAGYWMPIGEGHQTKQQAENEISKQLKRDAATRHELSGV